jgi:hypothetical protein
MVPAEEVEVEFKVKNSLFISSAGNTPTVELARSFFILAVLRALENSQAVSSTELLSQISKQNTPMLATTALPSPSDTAHL